MAWNANLKASGSLLVIGGPWSVGRSLLGHIANARREVRARYATPCAVAASRRGMMLPKLHRINAAAAALGVTRATIYRFVKQGKLTMVHLGKNSSAITEDSLRALMGENSQSASIPDTPADPQGTHRKVFTNQHSMRANLVAQIEVAIEKSSGRWHGDEFRISINGLRNLCNTVVRITGASGSNDDQEARLTKEQFDAIAYAVLSLGMVIFRDADRLRHLKALRAVLDATSPGRKT
ncbi:hypothetical protein PT2222_330098 [Paraburkholderia tropica]